MGRVMKELENLTRELLTDECAAKNDIGSSAVRRMRK